MYANEQYVHAEVVATCPKDVSPAIRADAQGIKGSCKHCDLNHDVVELLRIGRFVYGDKPEDSKNRWLNDGTTAEYISRLQQAIASSYLAEHFREMISSMEVYHAQRTHINLIINNM